MEPGLGKIRPATELHDQKTMPSKPHRASTSMAMKWLSSIKRRRSGAPASNATTSDGIANAKLPVLRNCNVPTAVDQRGAALGVTLSS
jgi:hypothetical protein